MEMGSRGGGRLYVTALAHVPSCGIGRRALLKHRRFSDHSGATALLSPNDLVEQELQNSRG